MYFKNRNHPITDTDFKIKILPPMLLILLLGAISAWQKTGLEGANKHSLTKQRLKHRTQMENIGIAISIYPSKREKDSETENSLGWAH